ncbi:MAG: glycogen debranching enzyme N-terminal domain-containing protein [Kiritimatiellae bacterium]|nr:glycogen debranching enzyme N-terminal domain-containing protein [Kiritimatiellia bacterium]
MKQLPAAGSYQLRWRGDSLEVSLQLDAPRKGRAVFRTEIGGAALARREIIEANDQALTPLEKHWRDVPLTETSPGCWTASLPLDEVGIFKGKCCFFPADSTTPEWPEGDNLTVKVMSHETRGRNAIYTVFPRQFGSFREIVRRLDFILGTMGFNIIQTLPPFPVPTTYAVMGEYGCPFAATDFFSVDPAMAEFDSKATPLDQFRELIGAVHARGGRLFVDLPANHTGWASTLQTHHPEWFHRENDGTFVSPGAWGVTWADLVELDYSHPALRSYMADVFLFWVRNGVDGFRCDAGYMIPEATWRYIVARVREEYPDTVFMLEGLGGKLEVTDALLNRAGLDWAYSEIFQTYDRGAFEWYLPGAIERARTYGTLVHFAETHDNDRLAKGGRVWARLRVALAALLSYQGAWGVANGVEWFATEKIDVHGKNDLNWGASENLVDFIAQLNALIARHPDFRGNEPIRLVERGEGNFLAVVRGSTLILANLDCGQGVVARWDDAAFPSTSDPFDLLQTRRIHLEQGLWLEPGEVRVFSHCTAESEESQTVPRQDSDSAFVTTWTYPQDLQREVCVPAGSRLKIVAPCAFRARLQDGVRTCAVVRSAGGSAVLAVPPYQGDGTSALRRKLVISVYAPDGIVRSSADVLLLPSAEQARVKLVYTGAEIRRNLQTPGPGGLLETVLSDGAGAASRVKLAWGEIRSQYDALLAANPNPHVPADRLTLWTRCRCWLQHEGYSREINADCIDSFRADPAGRKATWFFTVPCGLGRVAKFVFCLFLAQDGTGVAKLQVRRVPADEADVGSPVTLVFRPDLEWRSFHGTTKAQGAVENAFARATQVLDSASGFVFSPYGKDERLVVAVSNGVFHPEGAWSYCVSHAEEAARGQDGCGDLYSPGWISSSLKIGDEAILSASYVSDARTAAFDEAAARRLLASRGTPEDESSPAAPLDDALREALKLFIVKRDDVKTVLAGYPWFLDWGRDTFIFLQGAIPAGFRTEALAIVEAFARFEEKGTLPNIISGETAGNRDTVDAPLWFIRTLAVLGKEATKFRPVAESIVSNYLAGTSNGIHVDPASGLVWTPSHFTWMDTNYPACTPRVGYPVEIQAMWIAALRYLGGSKWNDLADQAVASLIRFFVQKDEAGRVCGLADCLDAPNGEPAAQAVPDRGVRPNQLFVLSLDVLSACEQTLARAIVQACAPLVVPGGVRSLVADDTRYRGVYAGDEDTQRKPAYHNGTVWAWPFPLYAEALVKTGLATKATARSLLASAIENINAGCVCHLSEIADGDAPHAQKGCRAQAWSASELLRVWLKLK